MLGGVERVVEEIDVFVDEPSYEPFELLYQREFGRAVRLAHLLTGSNESAEDLAQEAFMRLRPKLGSIDNPSAYLTATIVNVCRNWHRSGARRNQREISTADTEASSVDVHDEILDMVDQLPFRQRAVLVARYWLDLSEREIAEVVGCRPGTVKSLASRALKTLREELE